MSSLRHNRLRLALALLLAMVCSIAGVPARAAACGDAVTPMAVPPVSLSCEAMAQPGPCCCGPRQDAAAPATAGIVTVPGCGCSVKAPATPAQPGLKAATLVTRAGPALLSGTFPSLQPPAGRHSVLLPASDGPPRAPHRASTPSRAPPAS